MIYIVGHTFQFNPRSSSAQSQSISIQERIVNSKRNTNNTKVATHNDNFVRGATYRVSRIAKTNDSGFQYIFTNLHESNAPDINITFTSTSIGDDYIASVSGDAQRLSETRHAINASQGNGES